MLQFYCELEIHLTSIQLQLIRSTFPFDYLLGNVFAGTNVLNCTGSVSASVVTRSLTLEDLDLLSLAPYEK